MKKILKKIELKFRKLFLAIIQSQSKIPQKIIKPANIFEKNKNWKIIILRQDRIGDLLISVPFLKTLKFDLKNSVIDIVLSEKNKVAKNCITHYTDSQFILPKNLKIIPFLFKLRKKHYDICIDLFDNSSATSSFLIKYIKPKCSIGLEKSNASIYDYVVPLKNKNEFHIIERIADLLFPFNINPNELNLSLEYKLPVTAVVFAKKYFSQLIQKDREKNVLGINIAGSSEAKFWGAQNNINFIKEINKHFPEVVVILFGTNDYLEIMNEIKTQTNSQIASQTKNFDEYAAMISDCNFLLTPDTSAVHLAACFKIPCICLYTTSDGNFGMVWTPYHSPYKMLVAKNTSLNQISVNSVFEAFNELYCK